MNSSEIKEIILQEAKKMSASPVTDHEHPSDVEAVEDAWSGGDNLHVDIDWAKEVSGHDTVKEPEILQIVAEQAYLRDFIRESIKELLG